MLTHKHILTIALVALVATPACRQRVDWNGDGDTGGGNLALDAVKPASVKANFIEIVEVTGEGFTPTATVMINGDVAEAIPGVTTEYVSANLFNVKLDQSATWLKADDWDVEIVDGFTRAPEVQPLHIRPVLERLEYVRTLPEFFAPEGGELEIWAQPVDSEEIVMLPGHEIAGTDGFTKENFDWANITLRHTVTGDIVTPTTADIIRVTYGPRFVGDPLGFVVAIDNSGSMGNADPDDRRFDATAQFADRLTTNALLMTIGFSNNPTIRVDFTNDKQAITDDLVAFQQEGEGGGTALYDAMLLGLDELETLGPQASKVVIALTDGRDQDSQANVQDVITRAQGLGAQIFSIGLGDGGNLDSADLINIAQATGGSYFQVDDADALPQIFDQLAAYQADSYIVEAELGFDPPLQDMGKYEMTLDLFCNADGEEEQAPVDDAILYVGQ